MEVKRPLVLSLLLLAAFMCGCARESVKQSDWGSAMTNPVIQIHGEFRLTSGAYDIAIMDDGNVVYSNYPLPVERSQVDPGEIRSILSDMRRAGYWTVDGNSLSNALADVVIQDATRITLTASWHGEVNVATFERDSLFSPVAEKCKTVSAVRHSVDLIERKVLASRLP